MRNVRIGFSTLSLFWKSPAEWAEAARADGFRAIEILCEGPQWPRHADAGLIRECTGDCDLEVYLHSPTIDLNPASVNPGIRKETLQQLRESVDMAVGAGALYVTTHPGIVHRDKVRRMCSELAKQVLGEAADYARSAGIGLSIENMPAARQYLCNTPEELSDFRSHCRCGITIDVGHANLYSEPREFLRLPEISYLHVNDNKGERDQHLCPGEGTLDLTMLRGQARMIIELDDYSKVLKGREAILRSIMPVNYSHLPD